MAMKQLLAVFGVLAFLGTFALVLVTGTAFLAVEILGEERLSRWAGAASQWFFSGRGLARKLLIVLVILVGGYGATLVGASTMSQTWNLAPGEQKYFCEIDCHLAYSIARVEKLKTIESGASKDTAGGTYYVIGVRTRFDERTISPHRGDGPLTPSPRVVTLVDDQGREYSVAPQAQQALEDLLGNRWTPMTRPLRPGESYVTPLVFDLPAGVSGLKLLVASPTEPAWLGHLLIGDEDSLFHKKVYLRVAS